MKKLIALAVVAIASHVALASAGEAVASSKEVAAPPPPLPTSYFRSNEFSLGLFGSYGASFNNNTRAIGITPGEVVLMVNTSPSNISASQSRVISLTKFRETFSDRR